MITRADYLTYTRPPRPRATVKQHFHKQPRPPEYHLQERHWSDGDDISAWLLVPAAGTALADVLEAMRLRTLALYDQGYRMRKRRQRKRVDWFRRLVKFDAETRVNAYCELKVTAS